MGWASPRCSGPSPTASTSPRCGWCTPPSARAAPSASSVSSRSATGSGRSAPRRRPRRWSSTSWAGATSRRSWCSTRGIGCRARASTSCACCPTSTSTARRHSRWCSPASRRCGKPWPCPSSPRWRNDCRCAPRCRRSPLKRPSTTSTAGCAPPAPRRRSSGPGPRTRSSRGAAGCLARSTTWPPRRCCGRGCDSPRRASRPTGGSAAANKKHVDVREVEDAVFDRESL